MNSERWIPMHPERAESRGATFRLRDKPNEVVREEFFQYSKIVGDEVHIFRAYTNGMSVEQKRKLREDIDDELRADWHRMIAGSGGP